MPPVATRTKIRRSDIRQLAESRSGPCLSIFVPADGAGLPDLLRRGEELLWEQGWPSGVSEEVCRPIRHLSAQSAAAWDGSALFSAPGFFRTFQVSFELPALAAVAGSFHLRPLILGVEPAGEFHVLVLNLDGARLFCGDNDSFAEMNDTVLPSGPASWEAARRSGGSALPWLRQLDEVIRTHAGVGGGPLVLAGAGDLCSLFRQVSHAECVLADEIPAGLGEIGLEGLHRRARAAAETFFHRMRERTADEYYQLWHTPRASNDVRNIASAARDGRVKTLFVTRDFRPEEDLLEAAALHTFIAGGTVYTVPADLVPGRGAAAAIFRY